MVKKNTAIFLFLVCFVSLSAATKIALLRSNYTIQLYAPNPNWGNYDSLHVISAKQLLAKLPFTYDVVNDQFIELDSLITKGYQVIIVPSALAMSTIECNKIEAFVNQGGTALIVGGSGIFNYSFNL